jgi:hypothetical protein
MAELSEVMPPKKSYGIRKSWVTLDLLKVSILTPFLASQLVMQSFRSRFQNNMR